MKKNQKYRLEDDGSDWKRVVALKSWMTEDGKEVAAGDIGGFVHGPHNLAQTGRCWIDADSRVRGGARITGNAVLVNTSVGDHARVEGSSILIRCYVMGDARIAPQPYLRCQDSTFGDGAVVTSGGNITDSRISGKVRGDTYMSSCQVRPGATVVSLTVTDAVFNEGLWRDSPVVVYGPMYHANFCKKGHLRIGCQVFPIETWLEAPPNIVGLASGNGLGTQAVVKWRAIIRFMADNEKVLSGLHYHKTKK